MTNEKRNALITVLSSLLLGAMCAYGIITLGGSWIFTMGLTIGSLMLIISVLNVIFDQSDED